MNMNKSIEFIRDVMEALGDKWRVHIDNHAEDFTVYCGALEICQGKYDLDRKIITGISYFNPLDRKNNKITFKVTNAIKKSFPEYEINN